MIVPVMSYDDWLAVMKAILAIDHLSLDYIAGVELSDGVVKQFEPMLADIEAGQQALAPYVEDATQTGPKRKAAIT